MPNLVFFGCLNSGADDLNLSEPAVCSDLGKVYAVTPELLKGGSKDIRVHPGFSSISFFQKINSFC